jgi:phosphoribosyl 1,2-cyclic phosphate phosphodiesterase
MSHTLRVTILGCGSSGGVPRATGDWGVCDPNEPRNRRSRCSILVQQWRGPPGGAEEATTVLIDTAPDLRTQLAEAKPTHIDAVLYTHDHADQTQGIDDLRAYVIASRKRMPIFMDAATRATLHPRFAYCFEGVGAGYPAILEEAGELKPYESVRIDGRGGAIDFLPLTQDHGFSHSLGFKFGPCAYSNDVVMIPEQSLVHLRGLELWIVDALRETPHPTHAHLGRSLDWIADLKPSRAVLTNMHIDLDYRRLVETLPAGVEPAFDGLHIDLSTS